MSFSKAYLLSPENQALSEALLIIRDGQEGGDSHCTPKCRPAPKEDKVLTAVVTAREMMRKISHSGSKRQRTQKTLSFFKF